MSYALAASLQAAIFQRLSGLPELSGVPVLDAAPKGTGEGTFVLIGAEDVRDRSDKTGAGAEHRFLVSIVSTATGFQTAKSLAAAVSDGLTGTGLTLNRGRLVGLGFVRASARRLDEGRVRRIDMTFRARVEE